MVAARFHFRRRTGGSSRVELWLGDGRYRVVCQRKLRSLLVGFFVILAADEKIDSVVDGYIVIVRRIAVLT